MTFSDDIPAPVDERVERLICRCLDAEASEEDRAELDFILSHDEAARSVYEEYRRVDVLGGAALRHDFAKTMTAAAPRLRRGLWLATAGTALAAAAVLVFVVRMPVNTPPAGMNGPAGMIVSSEAAEDAPVRMLRAPDARYGEAVPVDYQFIESRPSRQHREHHRDWMGIRGPDKDVIYVLERDTTSSKVIPISSDF